MYSMKNLSVTASLLFLIFASISSTAYSADAEDECDVLRAQVSEANALRDTYQRILSLRESQQREWDAKSGVEKGVEATISFLAPIGAGVRPFVQQTVADAKRAKVSPFSLQLHMSTSALRTLVSRKSLEVTTLTSRLTEEGCEPSASLPAQGETE